MRTAVLSLILLVSVAHSDPCPDGYSQAPNGGDCYKILWYFEDFIGQHYPSKTYDEVEVDCNLQGRGMLASIHTEENENIQTLMHATEQYCGRGSGNSAHTNFGLRCVGKDCKWDDGSPVTYTNFDGAGPSDDKRTRCYGVRLNQRTWIEKECDKKYESDCWLCSVKAKTIECDRGEVAYKGGCASVHLIPQDQKTAEASCPNGGHLVSVHSFYEGNDYSDLAELSGARGTIYIGGQFSNGKFEWLDGTYNSFSKWANGFPNNIFGSCVQMLLKSELGSDTQWTNVDCSIKQPYMCFRNGGVYGPTAFLQPPKAEERCPDIQYYSGSGSIYSPNYPLSIPTQQSCEYVLGTKEGTLASVKFPVFNCTSGTTLSLYDGLNSNQPFLIFSNVYPSINQSYTAKSNVMKMVFAAKGTPIGTGWEAEFNGI